MVVRGQLLRLAAFATVRFGTRNGSGCELETPPFPNEQHPRRVPQSRGNDSGDILILQAEDALGRSTRLISLLSELLGTARGCTVVIALMRPAMCSCMLNCSLLFAPPLIENLSAIRFARNTHIYLSQTLYDDGHVSVAWASPSPSELIPFGLSTLLEISPGSG